jgi:hypothetical protein
VADIPSGPSLDSTPHYANYKNSRRLPTAASRVRGQVGSCGICDGKGDSGAGFLQVLRFSLPISIPPTAPH